MLYDLVELINESLNEESDKGLKKLSERHKQIIETILSEKMPEVDGTRLNYSSENVYTNTFTKINLYSTINGEAEMCIDDDQLTFKNNSFYLSYKINPFAYAKKQLNAVERMFREGKFEIFRMMYYYGNDLVYIRKEENNPFNVYISIYINGKESSRDNAIEYRVRDLIPEINLTFTCRIGLPYYDYEISNSFYNDENSTFDQSIIITEEKGKTLFEWRKLCASLIDNYRETYIDVLMPKSHR